MPIREARIESGDVYIVIEMKECVGEENWKENKNQVYLLVSGPLSSTNTATPPRRPTKKVR